jgi:hypothetical protein
LLGIGNPRVPITRSGMGMGVYLYPSTGIGFLTGMFFFMGTGMGSLYPVGTYLLPSLSITPLMESAYLCLG